MVIKNISVAGSHDFNNSKKELSDQFVKNELERVQDLMKQDKFTGGDKINKKLWPKKYQYKYHINNLWRYSIGRHYRLLYTIATFDDVKTYALLDILTHDKYNKLFHYHTS